jgi:hypothetical protein
VSQPRAIEPRLFDFVVEYADEISAGQVIPGRARGKTSKAITFCENAFAQFFAAEFGHDLTGFNMRAKRQAVDLRLANRDRSPEVLQIITIYETFCDDFPDIMGAGYGGGMLSWNRLHTRLIPRFLDRLNLWAIARRDLDLARAIQESSRRYSTAIRKVGW